MVGRSIARLFTAESQFRADRYSGAVGEILSHRKDCVIWRKGEGYGRIVPGSRNRVYHPSGFAVPPGDYRAGSLDQEEASRAPNIHFFPMGASAGDAPH